MERVWLKPHVLTSFAVGKNMAFIRVKKIRKSGKVYEYAYLVENRWKKRKRASRQKVTMYLGKVIRLEKVKEEEIVMPESLAKEEMIKSLARHELLLRGFQENRGLLEREGMVFNQTKLNFNQRAVIEMNEGFLSEFTLKRVLAFRRKHEDDREDGIKLAQLFLEAGLKIPKDAFVRYFEKG